DRERAGRVVRQEPAKLALGDDRLDDRREREAEDQRPEDLPEHPERERERVDELGADVDGEHQRVRAKRRTAASSSSVFARASRSSPEASAPATQWVTWSSRIASA